MSRSCERFVAARKQDHDGMSAPDKVNTVTRTIVDAKFGRLRRQPSRRRGLPSDGRRMRMSIRARLSIPSDANHSE